MVGGVLLVTLLLYLRCLGNGFVFDDNMMIVKNAYIGSWSLFRISFSHDSWWYLDPLHLPASSYYRPLQDTWLGLHFHLFGLNPAGWHATMVALHLVVVWLVFRLASHLTGDRQAALLAAALFAVLPCHAEAVVWASAIPLPLAAAFELAALLLFIGRAQAPYRNWALAMLLYAGALLTHESAVMLPVLVALYGLIFERPDRATADRSTNPSTILRARMRATAAAVSAAPFAAELLVYLAVRFLVLGFISRPMVGDHLTYGQALMSMPGALAIYLRLLMVPWAAGPAHRLLPPAGLAAPDFLMATAMVVVAAGIFGLAIRNSSRRELYLFCAAWMAISIAPAVNLPSFSSDMIVQDRYLYLPSVGWCLMVATALAGFARRNPHRQAVWAGTAAVLVAYGAALWNAQHYWHDDYTLCRIAVEEFPGAAVWHAGLGAVLLQRHDIAGAAREVEQWRSLTRDFHRRGGGRELQTLGLLYAQLGRYREAELELSLGLQLEPASPATSYTKLAELYDLDGDEQRSEQILKSTESLPDGAEEVAIMRARIEMRHGDTNGAEKALRDLTGHYPNDERVWTMLGLLLTDENRDDEALAAYQRSIGLAPQDPRPYFYAARLLHAKGRNREALDDCHKALAIDPNHAGAASLMNDITRSSAGH